MLIRGQVEEERHRLPEDVREVQDRPLLQRVGQPLLRVRRDE